MYGNLEGISLIFVSHVVFVALPFAKNDKSSKGSLAPDASSVPLPRLAAVKTAKVGAIL